ncbi:solute carrier family 22 member 18-like isoform X2 [Mya arenaria]|uniref:solute carrier family 22 member 18-like isoform X2 n=1 Tax=Mya arenaria TaxID=6604 RepID=UPI0022E69D0C|nr:solute carrier family 22 member 18-like isoform X2 [Mya arenaria]
MADNYGTYQIKTRSRKSMGEKQGSQNDDQSEVKTDPTVMNALQDIKCGETQVHDYKHNIRVFKWSLHKVIIITHFNIFLYSTCFWIQIGTLPYLSKKLGVNAVWYGYLQTTFAVVQLAGGPLFGRFGDIFGSRAAMTLAFVSAALSYLLLSMSSSVSLLFLSRLPSVFMHAMQGGQMIVTDICDSGKRADALGKLGISYGVGMIIGPAIGGIITTNFGEATAAFVAFLGSVLSILLVLMFVPHQTKKTQVHEKSSSALLDLKKWRELIMAPGALFLLLLKMATGTPIGIFQSMFQVIALEIFSLPADQNGYLMSYIGVLTMVVQGLGVGILLKQMSENSIMKWSSFVLVWAYLALAGVGTIPQLCIVLAPLTVGLANITQPICPCIFHIFQAGVGTIPQLCIVMAPGQTAWPT